MPTRPLTAQELEARLDDYLDGVLYRSRTTTAIARAAADLSSEDQQFLLDWVQIIIRTNTEMGFQFATHAPRALRLMNQKNVESWLIEAMDVYDKEGIYPAIARLKDIEGFALRMKEEESGVSLGDITEILELFLCGLSGRRLKLDASTETYTDTSTIFLAPRLAVFPSRDENFLLYKATAALLWAQTRFGTFRIDLEQLVLTFPDPAHALRWFNFLEGIRLESHIKHRLPGLARDMASIRGHVPRYAEFSQTCALRPVDATIDLLTHHYPEPPPEPWCYLGELFPERVRAAKAERMTQEKEHFRHALAQLAEEIRPPHEATASAPAQFELNTRPDEHGEAQSVELTLDGQTVVPPADVTQLIDSIMLDLGHIPPEYLVAAGDGAYQQNAGNARKAEDVWKGTYHEEGAFLYNEWDCERKHYRKHWCVLRELDVHPLPGRFVAETLEKYRGQVIQIKRTFEVLRGEEKLLKKQKQGDDIDLDAVVEGYADMRSGEELPDRLFMKLKKAERNMAVMFMVDMSGSTKGWINDAEREALVMLCEALETLGDRYAIYGFSGITRKRCEIYRIKRFDEEYSDTVKARIAGITPQDYTRMGVAIRHLSRLLNEVDAKTKLLVTLSDGKPDDYFDIYRGEYGIEDTRQALFEAHRTGIHPFCITIDKEAKDYLPHMYGAAHYVIVDDVRKLPIKVADIYRKLTT